MASLRKRGKIWYFRFVDAEGVKQERKGCPDKRETERLAVEVEAEIARTKAGLVDPKAVIYRRHESRPLIEHLADWRRDMIVRGKTDKHADQYFERAGKLAGLAKGTTLTSLEPGRKKGDRERAAEVLATCLKVARLSDLAPEQIQAALGRLHEAGKSHQTVNHYRAALRAFARWAWDNGRLRESPMRGVKGFNVEEDRRHERRSLTDRELSHLIRAASSGPTVWGMPGPLRAMAYRLAAATGFRVAELRMLTPESFRLAGTEPSISLRASSTKNRRSAEQPITLALARDLPKWLEGMPPGMSVLPLHHETAKAMRTDLEAAGIPYETDEGVADFHSLRSYYVSALVRSGASIKEVQTLARHAKPQTTLGHYAKVSIRDLRGAIESIPEPDLSSAGPELQATTCTTHEGPNLAHQLPTAGDGPGRGLSVPGGETPAGPHMAARDGESQVVAGDGLGRGSSAPGVLDAERGGFEPPRPVSQSNGLANRRFRPLSHLSLRARRGVSGDQG